MELNYDTHDKELLTIFEAFKHWCQYLEGSGTPIDVVTDHKIWNISQLLNSLPDAKLDGLNSCPNSTWSSVSNQEN